MKICNLGTRPTLPLPRALTPTGTLVFRPRSHTPVSGAYCALDRGMRPRAKYSGFLFTVRDFTPEQHLMLLSFLFVRSVRPSSGKFLISFLFVWKRTEFENDPSWELGVLVIFYWFMWKCTEFEDDVSLGAGCSRDVIWCCSGQRIQCILYYQQRM